MDIKYIKTHIAHGLNPSTRPKTMDKKGSDFFNETIPKEVSISSGT